MAAAPVTTAPELARATRSSRWMGDEQLARLAARGNEHAFAAIYERYLPKLVRYCQGIVLQREDAEDAAQTAMLKAMKALAERPQEVNLRPWLYRIAHNEAVSLLRRRRPEQQLDERIEAIGAECPEETVHTRARLKELVADLRELPERQRGALVMRELCGLDYEEIAGVIGGSRGAAMQTVFEARSTLVQFDEGRRLSCELVQRAISDGDRRRLRARGVRAHMRGCVQCRTFDGSLERRRRDLALLIPAGGKGALMTFLGIAGAGGARTALSFSSATSLSGQGWRVAALGLIAATAAGGEAVHHLAAAPHRASGASSLHATHVAEVAEAHAAAAARALSGTHGTRRAGSHAGRAAARPGAGVEVALPGGSALGREHRDRTVLAPSSGPASAGSAASTTSSTPSTGSNANVNVASSSSGSAAPASGSSTGSGSSFASNSFWNWVVQQAVAQAENDEQSDRSSVWSETSTDDNGSTSTTISTSTSGTSTTSTSGGSGSTGTTSTLSSPPPAPPSSPPSGAGRGAGSSGSPGAGGSAQTSGSQISSSSS